MSTVGTAMSATYVDGSPWLGIDLDRRAVQVRPEDD